VWNRIPEWEKERVVDVAREYPEKSCREIDWLMTDQREYFISESSVYRILKASDLITSPVFTVVSAKDKFEHPTTRTNELWQTCPACKRVHEKLLTIEEALRTMPIPIKTCANRADNKSYAFCSCSYFPEDNEEF
jgi:hypothetical protein